MSRYPAYDVPLEYQTGIFPGNALAVGGFVQHSVTERYQPINGTSFGPGSLCKIKAESHDTLVNGDELYLKFQPELYKDKVQVFDLGNMKLATEGWAALIRSIADYISGVAYDNIPEYNRFCGSSYINSSLEHKVSLQKTDNMRFLINGSDWNSPDVKFDFKNGFVMHKLNLPLLNSLGLLELPLLGSGVDFEIGIEQQLNKVLKKTGDATVAAAVDEVRMGKVELVWNGIKPSQGFWEQKAHELANGGVIEKMAQVVKHQSFNGNNSSQVNLKVESGDVRSVSSVKVLGIPGDYVADIWGHKDKGGAALDITKNPIDTLSYSSDLGTREVYFTVGGKRAPLKK
ncbi:hypothetical protein HK097_004836, partial [Rhizophlyctis rosea]